jgi:hypothetical protein
VESVRHIYKLYTDSTVLSWSTGMRMAAVFPVLILLWLTVWWATLAVAPL